MEKRCRFCGEVLVDNKCPNTHEFKRMCLNCRFCEQNDEGYFCRNDENANTAMNQIMEAANKAVSSYEIKNLEIAALPLKKPELKCRRWEFEHSLDSDLHSFFV